MANTSPAPDVYISSDIQAKNNYGQNGFQGSSSDLPGKHTTSGFLPQVKLPNADANFQTRKVENKAYANTFGMKGAATGAAVPKKVSYLAGKPVREVS